MFYEMLKQNNSVENIIHFCSEVLYPEIALKYKPLSDDDSVLSEFSSDSNSSEEDSGPFGSSAGFKPDRFANFCRKLSSLGPEALEKEVSTVKMSTEEKLGMIYAILLMHIHLDNSSHSSLKM